ncbi:MAG: hypothetical protein KKD18_02855 [Nanoarchaeota archaeon]|nr:hypothetical protein [Nanoarchaeota archaeon]MBU0977329.1 hypothetical protein [Nanoarchaeota archaeon]
MVYHNLPKIKNKKAAIELSIGTVVIIVLAMTMLILGILLIRNIFSTATGAVTEIDQGVKNEINKLFSENQDKILVIYPDSGIIKLPQGSQDAGFVVAIRNTASTVKTYDYTVTQDSQGNCATHPYATNPPQAQTIVGGSGTGIQLQPGKIMENPRHVRISISDTASTCTFGLKIEVKEAGTTNVVATGYMDVEITPS